SSGIGVLIEISIIRSPASPMPQTLRSQSTAPCAVSLALTIIRQLELLHDVRLQAVLRPDPLHGTVRHTGVAAHAPHAPAFSVLRRPRRVGDHTLDFLLCNRRLASAPALVVKTVEAVCLE